MCFRKHSFAVLLVVCLCSNTASSQPLQEGGVFSERIAGARMSVDQALGFVTLGVPIVVPSLTASWTLDDVIVIDSYVGITGMLPDYTLSYRREDGVCFDLTGYDIAGIGDTPIENPTGSSSAALHGIATYDAETPLMWDEEHLVSEYFGVEVIGYALRSPSRREDCGMLSPADAKEILEGVRYLDPRDDIEGSPVFNFLTGIERPAFMAPRPYDAAEIVFDQHPAARDIINLLKREHYAVVYLTSGELMDDSVRTRRIRAVAVPTQEGGWQIWSSGEQVRCYEGRGHTDWGAEPCF